jgi:transcriptional regulator
MQVEWRRNKVQEMLSKGDSQSEIAKTLRVDLSIISRDVYFLRQQAKDNIKRYIERFHASISNIVFLMYLCNTIYGQ